LTEWGQTYAVLKNEIDDLKKYPNTGNDSYILALVALVLVNVGMREDANAIARKLQLKQWTGTGGDIGVVRDVACTVTRSGEPYKSLEGTALAVIVWCLTDPGAYASNIDLALEYLQRKCSFGAYGTSQANTLVLKAIMTHAQLSQYALAKPGSPTLYLFVDDVRLIETTFNSRQSGALELKPFHQALSPGLHKFKIVLRDYDGTLPYSVGIVYNTLQPDSDPNCPVKLVTELSSTEMKEGEGGEVRVTLQNVTNQPLPMAIAIIGLPGGLEVRHEKLKELVKTEQIDFWEGKGRDIVCYWRGMHPNGKVEFNLDVTARIPGKYQGSASRAYLYYSPDSKCWVDGLQVKIEPVDIKVLESMAKITTVNTPTPTPQKHHSVAEFLDSIKLGQYKKAFEDQGWDDMEDAIDEIDDDELVSMKIEKKGHRKKILRCFAEWQGQQGKK